MKNLIDESFALFGGHRFVILRDVLGVEENEVLYAAFQLDLELGSNGRNDFEGEPLACDESLS